MPETPTDELKKILSRPNSAADLNIPSVIVSDLIYRVLFNEGDVSVSRLAEVIKIHGQVLDEFLSHMKQEHLVEIVKAGTLGRLSYVYRLTDEGIGRARDAMERSQYIDAAPVDIESYTQAVRLQSQNKRQIKANEVKRALSHLILPENFHRRIGPAINSSASLFLYGPPGNGKTTIAQAIAKIIAGTEPIWLPYAITIGGQIIKIHDVLYHETIPLNDSVLSEYGKIDQRWGLFKRPAIMVGGELTMEALDARYDPIAKFYEAPLQMKANGGMFLIDDFGRQAVSPDQLLNRWIVPLENEIDFLRLRSGQTLEYPFQQLIVFSTNLDPLKLMDAAFLRRIQMKVEVFSPDEKMFYQIFSRICLQYQLSMEKEGFLHLLRKWYVEPKRVMQAVHPRDIVRTLVSICNYEEILPRLTPELIDEACTCYFVDSPNGR